MRTCNCPCRRSVPTHGPTIHARPVPFGSSVLLEDFVRRLTPLKEASGLTWSGFAEALGVDPKQILRWRHGTEPCGGAMHSLTLLAARIPGGLELLMGEGFQPLGRAG